MEGLGLLMHTHIILRTLTQQIKVPKCEWNNSQTPNVHRRQPKKKAYVHHSVTQARISFCLLSCSTHFLHNSYDLTPSPAVTNSSLPPRALRPAATIQSSCLPSVILFLFLSILCGPAYEARHRVSLFGERQSYWIVKLQNNEAKMKVPHSLFSFACTHLIRRTVEGWGDKRQWEERGQLKKKREWQTDRWEEKRNVWKIRFSFLRICRHGMAVRE